MRIKIRDTIILVKKSRIEEGLEQLRKVRGLACALYYMEVEASKMNGREMANQYYDTVKSSGTLQALSLVEQYGTRMAKCIIEVYNTEVNDSEMLHYEHAHLAGLNQSLSLLARHGVLTRQIIQKNSDYLLR